MERHRYQEHPPRDEYRLTEEGEALWPVLAVMWQFGDDWLFDRRSGATIELRDERTGDTITPIVIDASTGEWLDLASTRVRPRR